MMWGMEFVHRFKNQSGQVAVVILLITVVLLTVGLSLATRTTQEIFLTQQESDSARVFNAAETGIESALSSDFSGITGQQVPSVDTTTVPGVTTTTSIEPVSSLETTIKQGMAAHVDLTGYTGSDIAVEWGKSLADCSDAAALLVSTYYREGATEKVSHYAVAPSGTGCATINDFHTSGTSGEAPHNYFRRATVPLPSSASTTRHFMRIRPLYQDSAIRVSATGLATQLYVIRSQAQTSTTGESRTIQVGRTLPVAPAFMDYSIYSGAHITHSAP